jgi:sulfur-oxidizing protein SoxB
VICDALISQREAEIALSPGFRWGAGLLPGEEITREDIYNVTAMTYPNAYRTEMTGEMLKVILEDVADNLFNPDPYYQQGGDMVRIGGMGYRIDITKPQGERITDMTLLKTGEAIDPAKNYVVAGWASVNEGTEGPPIWDVVEDHIREQGTVTLEPNKSVDVVGAERRRCRRNPLASSPRKGRHDVRRSEFSSSRRKFLKGAAVATGALAAGVHAQAATPIR